MTEKTMSKKDIRGGIMNNRSIILAIIILFFAVSPGYSVDTIQLPKTGQGTGVQVGNNEAIKVSYMKLPLSFIKNEGQKDASVLFYEQGTGHATVFTNKGISHSLGSGKADMITLTPLNASPFTVEALDMKEGKVNYFTGKDLKNWKTNIPTYGAILYKGIYPGIDMKIYGTNNQLEYDLIVSPGADPSQICLSYTGAENLSITQEGDLAIDLKEGSILQKKPVLYQTINNTRKDIEGRFVLADATTYHFEIGPYDSSHPLVIDPVLAYSTYLGGNGSDTARAIAVDSSGNVYVAGGTSSTNFPNQSPYQGTNAENGDAFITKFNPSGSALVYSTYLGGNGSDTARAIAVDSLGNVYVAGATASTNFPTQSPIQGAYAGSTDAFVAKLNPSGSALVYSTYLGGNSNDHALAIAADSSGNAYVAGPTQSTNFPTHSPFQGTNAGGVRDAFVAKLNPSGSAVYSTYLGGNGYDEAYAIAADSSGNAYVAGQTQSTNFPTQGAYQGALAGVMDAFITKFNPSGSALVYSTYLGGSDGEDVYAIAVDSSGNAYVAGDTWSTNFPTQNPYQGTNAGGYSDAFITKFNPAGSALVYSTYLGGSDGDEAYAIVVDPSGNTYVAGLTYSTDFPTQNPYQGTLEGGACDAFVTKLDPAGSALVYSTYLGGNGYEEARAIAVDSSGNAYAAGYTSSTNFPTQSPYQGTNAGSYDAFVTKLTTPVLYATFPGTGLYQYNNSTWTQLTPYEPTAMTATGSLLYATFGNGVWQYNGSTWSQLTPYSPEAMVASGSLLYGKYPNGIWQYDGSTWTQLTPYSPIDMITVGSLLNGKYDNGIWQYSGSSWTQLTPYSPAAMVAGGSLLYGKYDNGIWQYTGSAWTQLTPYSPEAMVASGSLLYGKYDNGIWMYNGSIWSQVTPSNPEAMVASGSLLYGDFGSTGIWMYNGSIWTQITPNNPTAMIVP
jgi:hypothetical protein